MSFGKRLGKDVTSWAEMKIYLTEFGITERQYKMMRSYMSDTIRRALFKGEIVSVLGMGYMFASTRSYTTTGVRGVSGVKTRYRVIGAKRVVFRANDRLKKLLEAGTKTVEVLP